MAQRCMIAFLLILVGLGPLPLSAETYQEPADFIGEVFGSDSPEADMLWLDVDMKTSINRIMGHALNALRIRYWHRDGKTAWVMSEIGKEQPITVGFSIKDDAIEVARILVYREDRGYEVRYPWFTDQFIGMQLMEHNIPDRNVDGISGATLSVRAVTNLAHLALYFHNRVMSSKGE